MSLQSFKKNLPKMKIQTDQGDDYFENRLLEEINRAERYGHFLSLLVIELMAQESFWEGKDPLERAEFGKKFQKMVRMNTRKTDIMSTYENNYFFLLLPETIEEGALCLVNRLKNQVGCNFTGKERGNFSLYFGITSYPTDAGTKEELLENAAFLTEVSKEKLNQDIYIFSRHRKETIP